MFWTGFMAGVMPAMGISFLWRFRSSGKRTFMYTGIILLFYAPINASYSIAYHNSRVKSILRIEEQIVRIRTSLQGDEDRHHSSEEVAAFSAAKRGLIVLEDYTKDLRTLRASAILPGVPWFYISIAMSISACLVPSVLYLRDVKRKPTVEMPGSAETLSAG